MGTFAPFFIKSILEMFIIPSTIFSYTDGSNFRIHSGAYYPKVLGNNFHQSPLISFSLHHTYAYVLSIT
jgi:hypothetical protein